MKTNAAANQQLECPDAEPRDLAACFAEQHGVELIVEMAHDLRSPLTSILFLAETLQRGQSGLVTEPQRRQLGLIRSAALGLCATASDLLELARGGDRLAQQKPAHFSISDVFDAVRDLVTPLAEEKRLELRFLAPDRERRIGHERALSRVLLNLTTNALKFTEQGCVEVAARERTGTWVEFSVRDTGPGIDLDSLVVLYQPFRKRAISPRHQFSSAGLGLAICRKLAAAMGSELKVTTRPGHGTKFSFGLELPPAPSVA